jgi:flagellar biosynthesis protein FlhF
MIVKRFYADTSREALRLVRKALGPEALILSSRDTSHGVEIMAVAADEVQSVTAAVAPPQQKLRMQAASPRVQTVPPRPQPAASLGSASPPALARPSAATGEPADAKPGYQLVHEVRVLRSLMEGQLAAFAYNDLKRRDAGKADLLRQLLNAGFSPALSRSLVAEIPDGFDPVKALRLTKATLQRRLPIASGSASLAQRGGVFALVGPTGVGKTTTVAKLAAECALRQGAGALALVTTDTYRIGAVDQLRIYGKILSVPVFAIRDEGDLRRTLNGLRTRHLILIDTVGMSQRDRRLTEQVALLAGGGDRVRRILLLSAVSQASVLEDVVRAYQGEDLSGCILTKVDEAVTLGGALDVLIRHRLTLQYVTNGQRVPEDLHRPNPLYLVERAFRAPGDQAAPDDTELPLLLAVSGQH